MIAQHPFSGRNVSWLLTQRAEVSGDKTFLIWEPPDETVLSWTYAEFFNEVKKTANGLSSRGLTVGDFLVVHLDNCPEFLFTWFACHMLGVVVVTTNTRSAVDELKYFFEHCGAKAALTQTKYEALVNEAAPHLDWVALTDVDQRDQADGAKRISFEDLRADETETASFPNIDPLAAGSVQYTSGTTSRPKGVVWTQANALWGAKVNAQHARLTPDDTHPVYFPLFHTNALGYSVLATLWSGGTVVLQPKFSASRFWEIALKYNCTWANMLGFTLNALLGQDDPPSHNFRMWACACDVQIIWDRWKVKTIGWWGMTETISQGIAGDLDWPNAELSMGVPTPEYTIRVIDDKGTDVAPGQTGNLQIKGLPGISLFKEYLNNPEATKSAYTDDGWLITGDLVTPIESGELFFADREKDMLKIGGENVAASEIERVILSVPGVKEAAVVGKKDDMLDEVPVAFVVALPGADLDKSAISAVCEKQLADFKRPRDIHFLEALPKGTMDKILKRDLRDMAESR